MPALEIGRGPAHGLHLRPNHPSRGDRQPGAAGFPSARPGGGGLLLLEDAGLPRPLHERVFHAPRDPEQRVPGRVPRGLGNGNYGLYCRFEC